MLHAGLDLSRKRLDVCLLSEHGELVERIAAPPDADGLLGTYRVDGQERELHAIRIPGEQTLQIIDVLAHPLREGGDVDQRHVEDRVGGLQEAEAIAADYTPLAEHLGWPPMPDVW